MSVELIHADCLEAMGRIPAGSVDAVITDPPYGIGVDEWDAPVDIAAFTAQAARVSRGFYAVFGQMPSLTEWHSAAVASGFRFLEHIVWVKRQTTPQGRRLGRSHESVFLYARHAGLHYHRVKGPYEDVKLPGVLVDTVTLEGIDRHIKDLHQKVQGRGTPIQGGYGRHPAYGRLAGMITDRSPRDVGYSNVWSFFPPNCAKKGGKHLHATAKPTDIMARLCEMLTPEGGVTLDPFMGSGTTGLACLQTGRNFIGIEKDAGYFAVAQKRLADAQAQLTLTDGNGEPKA